MRPFSSGQTFLPSFTIGAKCRLCSHNQIVTLSIVGPRMNTAYLTLANIKPWKLLELKAALKEIDDKSSLLRPFSVIVPVVCSSSSRQNTHI